MLEFINEADEGETAGEFISFNTGDVVTEPCPWCDAEVTIVWNVEQNGYKAFCPHCGHRLMLCNECQHDAEGEYLDDCDYCTATDTCRYNRKGEPQQEMEKDDYTRNAEHYADPTPAQVFRNYDRQQQAEDSEWFVRAAKLIRIMKQTAYLAGMDITSRIVLYDRKTGKEYK